MELKAFVKETLKLVLIAVVVVIPFRLFVAQPFIVDGASMDPTFRDNQYLVVDELSYNLGKSPERGSVLIFKYPKNPKRYYIKRVIGLPNEEILLNAGIVTIKNSANPEGLTLNEPYVVYKSPETSSFKLGGDEYFVMGDNRSGSSDSRYWGPVPEENIIGRPILRVWPFSLWPGSLDKFQNVEENEKD